MNTLLPRKFLAWTLIAIAFGATCGSAQDTSPPAMTLVVDETQSARRIAFVHEELRVRAGPLSLAYPRWIPGEHGPTGPIQQFAMLRIRAGKADLHWTRDPEEIFTIHVNIPAGVSAIDADFDTLMENTVSDHQLLIAWNTVVLYPRGSDKNKLMIQPSVILPQGWKQASSLTVTSTSGDRVNFEPTPLERLIDSPVLASEFLRVFQLNSSWPAELDVTGDTQAAIDKADDAHAADLYTKLIEQDRAMFGYRHWAKMHFLVSQSAAKPFDGLEHEDSPWDAVGDQGLSKKSELEKLGFPLLAHEQSHSWCGKYRRPAELYSKPDYQGPERTSLLWVYEGLNEYIGMLLATRSGFNDQNYMRDYLGFTADAFVHETARSAVPLVDTATEDWVLRSELGDWYDLRRSQDYYDEGALIWLRADVIIREQSHGQKSLDDFLRGFFGQRDTGLVVAPYTREDIEAALSAVLPYDWHNFFESRIYQVNPKPPLEGLESAGWRLLYNDTANKEYFWADLVPISVFAADSIGITVQKDSSIFDVVPNSPGYNAGLGPKMTIVAVDGRVYSAAALNEAIAHPPNGKISLVVRNFDSVETREIQYAGGVRYPHLEPIPGRPDYLSEILAPRSYEKH
jgi:predicted metalloprotease with PDZ domain